MFYARLMSVIQHSLLMYCATCKTVTKHSCCKWFTTCRSAFMYTFTMTQQQFTGRSPSQWWQANQFPVTSFPFPKHIYNDSELYYEEELCSAHKNTLVVLNRLATHQYIHTDFGLLQEPYTVCSSRWVLYYRLESPEYIQTKCWFYRTNHIMPTSTWFLHKRTAFSEYIYNMCCLYAWASYHTCYRNAGLDI